MYGKVQIQGHTYNTEAIHNLTTRHKTTSGSKTSEGLLAFRQLLNLLIYGFRFRRNPHSTTRKILSAGDLPPMDSTVFGFFGLLCFLPTQHRGRLCKNPLEELCPSQRRRKMFRWLALRNRCCTADRRQRRGLDHLDKCTLCD